MLYQHDGYHGQLSESSEIHSSVLTSVLEQKQLALCSRETDKLTFQKKKKKNLCFTFRELSGLCSSISNLTCATFHKGQTPKSNTWAMAPSWSRCQCWELSIVPVTLLWFLLGTAPLMLTSPKSSKVLIRVRTDPPPPSGKSYYQITSLINKLYCTVKG